MEANIISKIECNDLSLAKKFGCSKTEAAGDFFMTPFRELFGHTFHLVKTDIGARLNKHETFSNASKIALKVAAAVLLPLTLLLALVGLTLKGISRLEKNANNKYYLPVLVNARTKENFAGKLPPNPSSPNCVNSQQTNRWGKLYDAQPIQVASAVKDPMQLMQTTINADGTKVKLVEKDQNYLHYTYTVIIPQGPLKGTYIDDVDMYYDAAKRHFDIRSASRVGFRDAVHADFTIPGANKKRIEAIREKFTQACAAN